MKSKKFSIHEDVEERSNILYNRKDTREDNTWEPIKNITHTEYAIAEFNKSNPKEPSSSNNIQTLQVNEWDSWLYNEYAHTVGKGFLLPMDQQLQSDTIVPLDTSNLDTLLVDHWLSQSLSHSLSSSIKYL